MTPKEKAKELYNKNYRLFQNVDNCFGDCEEEYKKGNCTNSGHGCGIWFNLSKQCALIAVDEIDRVLQSASTKEDPYVNLLSLEYWQEVKQEIEIL